MRITPLLLLALAACTQPYFESTEGTAPVHEGPKERPTDISTAIDWNDVERYAGQEVSFDGLFTHIKGQHGVVTLDSGLRIVLPHIDLYLRDTSWFDHVGKRVRAGGILHTYTRDVPGYQGPSVDVNLFQSLE